jgi:hypothetical protein
MSYAVRSQSQDAEWKLVSEKNPCPICKSADGCHRDREGAFACCARRPSDWPLTSGAWLHRVERLEHLVSSAGVGALVLRAEQHVARSPFSGSTR